MSNATSTARITSVGTVFVTVSNQDAAIAFYRDKLGFDVRSDKTYGEGYRWVEVAPPEAHTVIALVPPMDSGEGAKPGETLTFSYDTDNLEAAMTELAARGVEFDAPMDVAPPVPPMVYFRDQDGNRVLLVQSNN